MVVMAPTLALYLDNLKKTSGAVHAGSSPADENGPGPLRGAGPVIRSRLPESNRRPIHYE